MELMAQTFQRKPWKKRLRSGERDAAFTLLLVLFLVGVAAGCIVGLFMTADNTVSALRLKSPEDTTSLPNPNAFAAVVLSELGEILQEKSYSDKARRIIDCFSRYALDNPLQCMTLLTANTLWKPVKKKTETPPAPPVSKTAALSDDELNRTEEPSPVQQDTPKTHAQRAARPEHSDAAARRRSARASRRRER